MDVIEALDKFVEKLYTNPSKENALNSVRYAQAFHSFDVYGPIPIAYRDRLLECGIYCKVEEQENWANCINALLQSMVEMSDEDWLYEAEIFDSTKDVLKTMSGDFSWDEVNEMVLKQNHSSDSLSCMSQLLLTFAPDGLAFVDNVVKPTGLLRVPGKLKNLYNTAKKEEMILKRKEASRFLKVIRNENFNS